MAKKYQNNTLSLPDRVASFVEEAVLCDVQKDRVLLSVSGGLDSMVMAHILIGMGVDCGILHCNFQLRGAESEGDAFFVEHHAGLWGVAFHGERIDTKALAEKEGISTQMAARSSRMKRTAAVLAAEGYHRIALAHHLNDHVETGIFNLVKGASYKGLGGIAPRRVGYIRPLLFLTRAEIAEYAHKHSIAWREDSSNASTDYTRNFIRHKVMPLLQEINPNVLHTAGNSLNRVRNAGKNLEYFYSQLLLKELKMGNGEHSLSKFALMGLPYQVGVLLYWLEPYGYDEEQCEQIADGLMMGTGKIFESKSWGARLLIDRQTLVLQFETKKPPVSIMLQINDLMQRIGTETRIFITEYQHSEDNMPDGRSAIAVDASLLKYPLTIRNVQDGDAFQPFGMDGKTKKLSDFMVDKKLSRLEKENCLVLVNGDQKIIWVMGYRADERFKIKEETTKATKFTLV